jgi:type I restriction-modification system DNA methylase subunit
MHVRKHDAHPRELGTPCQRQRPDCGHGGCVAPGWGGDRSPFAIDRLLSPQLTSFCRGVRLEEMKKNDFVLSPGRYLGVIDLEEDGTPFDQKLKQLKVLLRQQQQQSAN